MIYVILFLIYASVVLWFVTTATMMTRLDRIERRLKLTNNNDWRPPQ